MDHRRPFPRNDDPAEAARRPAALGWHDCLQWLGRRPAPAAERGREPRPQPSA